MVHTETTIIITQIEVVTQKITAKKDESLRAILRALSRNQNRKTELIVFKVVKGIPNNKPLKNEYKHDNDEMNLQFIYIDM